MLYGYSVVQAVLNLRPGLPAGFMWPHAYPGAPAGDGASAWYRTGKQAIVFPSPYGGAFERPAADGTRPRAGHGALSPDARRMLESKLEPDSARRMIQAIERMTAAASLTAGGSETQPAKPAGSS